MLEDYIYIAITADHDIQTIMYLSFYSISIDLRTFLIILMFVAFLQYSYLKNVAFLYLIVQYHTISLIYIDKILIIKSS